MNGLAFLRLAEMQNMPVQRDYPTIPMFARMNLGMPMPPENSWMSPERGVPQ